MKTLIAVLEDDQDIAGLVRHHLEGAGYSVRSYFNAAEVISSAETLRPALFLLDIMVPGGNGLDLCREIRHRPTLTAVPIIFLTAKASEADRVFGLDLGADDYITKPFSPRELVARVRAVLRRFEVPLQTSLVQSGDLVIDPIGMTITVRSKPIFVTATEFRLIDYFVRHAGRVFTRDNLLDAVWRDTAFVTPRSVDVYVRRIREKIERDPEDPEYLKTVRGVGYKFEAPK